MRYADLHVHSHFSDSTFSFPEIIAQALKTGIDCLSITDHDTLDFYASETFRAYRGPVEIIQGVELSSEYQGKEAHILGYFFGGVDSGLFDLLAEVKEKRAQRAQVMFEKLRVGGLDIAFEEFKDFVKGASISRMHLASFLKQKRFVKDIAEAFRRYLGKDCSAYMPAYHFDYATALRILKTAGALTFLAHPLLLGGGTSIDDFIRSGVDGLEVFYPSHNEALRERYRKIAKEHNLLVSGGSDCHGLAKDNTSIGRIKLPYEYVQAMKARQVSLNL